MVEPLPYIVAECYLNSINITIHLARLEPVMGLTINLEIFQVMQLHETLRELQLSAPWVYGSTYYTNIGFIQSSRLNTALKTFTKVMKTTFRYTY